MGRQFYCQKRLKRDLLWKGKTCLIINNDTEKGNTLVLNLSVQKLKLSTTGSLQSRFC